jgi:hypothetical protein
MAMKPRSTRRSFIRKTSAALSAPLAAAAVVVPGRAAAAGDSLADQLARLEDLNAIRALNQAFARQVSAGEAETLGIDPRIGSVVASEFGEHDVIEVASDRNSATGTMHCTVQVATPIGPSCPLVEMAREQGGGVVRRTEYGVFQNAYARRGVWSLERSTFTLIPAR